MRRDYWQYEGIIGRKMDIRGVVKALKGKGNWRKSLHILRECRHNQKQNVGRSMHLRSHSGEVSDGNEEQVIASGMIGYWKSDPYYRMF